MSLETTNYSDRREFVDRFSDAINRLIEVIYPPYVERLGVRYMNRVSDQTLIQNQLASMIRSEMLGGLATERPAHVELRHSISDSLFVDDEYAIQLRCGILPARAVLDTDIPPLENPVWILDIDSYREQKMGVDSDELTQELQFLADRAYRMFRWVVNADFIEHFK